MNVRDRTASAPGELSARYRSLFEIGRGGMGTIEVALERSAEGFERIVALKRMHPGASRERRTTEMFLREARLAAWLVHPNVVHAFDFGEIDGELFLAMEYVEGEPLSAIVRRARERAATGLPPALVAAILTHACDGLHAAHELHDPHTGAPLNVIHRDVSPHNVMVSYEGHVKLLDFGVAKMDSHDPLTRTGEVKGKTAYMSPEQAMGETLDRRSDLFSVGAVLFECISGTRMWGTGTDIEVMRRLALEAPPSLADAAPNAPRSLVELHARLVARDVRKRPATAAAVADELRAYVARTGIAADAAAIASTMKALFGNGAEERQRLLNEALKQEVPAARVEVLRRSLAGPTALASITPKMTRPRTSEAPTRPASITPAAPTRAPAPAESIAPKATRSGVIASVAVGLVVAVGIVAVTSAKGVAPVPAATATPNETAPAPASATAPASAPASASPSATATASAPASASPSAPPSPRAKRPPKPGSSSHVDVDTNPL